VGNIVEALHTIGVTSDDYVYLNYEDSAEVWHITDDYVQTALSETNSASMLAGLLATTGVRVLSRYEEDILETMRAEGLLDNYERVGWFEDYLTHTIEEEAYDYDLLTISTQLHDHKRGTCEVSVNVKVLAGDLYELGAAADALVSGFDVVVNTPNGLLTVAP